MSTLLSTCTWQSHEVSPVGVYQLGTNIRVTALKAPAL